MTTSPNPISYIRTWIPMAVGALITWLATSHNIIVDDATSAALIAGFNGLVSAIYYGVARLLEKVNPIFGYFLGVPKQPVYPDSESDPFVGRA